MREEITFSSILMGSIYALLRGDLETASKLGTLQLDEDPHAVEAHIILVHAHSGLEQWESAIKHGRLALCLGARDPQIGSFMIGAYRELGLNEEATWVEEYCNTQGFELSWSLTEEQVTSLKSELMYPPLIPKRRKKNIFSDEDVNESSSASFAWGGGASSDLPAWLEANESMVSHFLSSGSQADRPEWLSEESDSLESVFNVIDPFPDWLEGSEPIASLTATMQTSADQYSLSTTKDSAVQIQRESSTDEARDSLGEAKSEDLIASADHASLLGIGSKFLVAIDLDSLTLTTPSNKPKVLFGPLILALTELRLILVAYEDEFVRQKPWAFNPSQLTSINASGATVSIIVEGGREVAFTLHSPLLATSLVQSIRAWKQ